ncbi:hypothetical protein [Haliangium ochraceum]|uniref:Uncharacterized protein n=1 Tax=Haliangium ochraceum (strain DSM 14365 / JCM 11303 / SMP-2) TaxID=502025 RepID=D0LPH5_HALO1|nr:hypothetical protein [Haliangium ochraceum]ACY13540.1 hypothetical protein Hoch_0932 [Haliangium ochraceum DSM 14365]
MRDWGAHLDSYVGDGVLEVIYKGVLAWLENGEREYERVPFAGTLANGNPYARATVWLGDDFSEADARRVQLVGAVAQRRYEGLGLALTVMLFNRRGFSVVAPHFDPESGRHQWELKALVNNLAADSGGGRGH